MKKLTLLIGIGIGYVLGARAGRARYEQIKDTAASVAQNPKVQAVVDDVQAHATEAAQKAAANVKDAVVNRGSDTEDTTDLDVPPPGSTS